MKQFLIFFFAIVVLAQAEAREQIIKTQGEQGLIVCRSCSYLNGDTVKISDAAGDQVGTATVTKNNKGRIVVRRNSGRMVKGYWVEPAAGASPASGEVLVYTGGSKAITGFFGLYMMEGDDPMGLGGDFVMHYNKDIVLRAGLTYFSLSKAGIAVSGVDVAGGAGYEFRQGPWTFEGGGRLGVLFLSASGNTPNGLGGTVKTSTSDNSLHIGPHAAVRYTINQQISAGVELRIPIYLNSKFDNGNFYMLGSVSYSL